jgi:hypothetical protein
MHDFNGEDHDDGGTRSRKRSSEAYVTDPPRPSTFLEGDFNMPVPPRRQAYHEGVRAVKPRPRGTIYFQED